MSKNLQIWVIKKQNYPSKLSFDKFYSEFVFYDYELFQIVATQLYSAPFWGSGVLFCLEYFFSPKPRIILHFCSNLSSTIINSKTSTEVKTRKQLKPNKSLVQDGKLFDVHCFLTDSI